MPNSKYECPSYYKNNDKERECVFTNETGDVPILDTAYISTACNRSPLSADWSLDKEICFAAANSVAVFKTNYDGAAPKITETLTKHKSKVTSVRWIRNHITTSNDILSGSLDGTAILWSNKPHGYFIPVETFHVCNNGVAVVDGRVLLHQNGGSYYCVVAASIGSSVKIWTRHLPDTFNLLQTLDLNGRLCLTLSLNSLPEISGPMLAIAKDDNKIHLYLQKKSHFEKVDILVGHEDWVRGLDFIKSENKLMLASCSQDSHIRLWSIESHVENSAFSDHAVELRIERKVFTTENQLKWAVSLNAVLSGHEGWVYGVHWNRNVNTGKLKLLSSSIDKTLIIWEPQITDEGAEGIWMEKVRVGEVGGNGLGFYGGKISPDGESIMGHGYAGSFHIWNRNEDTDNWEPAVVCGGHYNEVVDIGWEPEGNFLVSISTDQTTRIHAPWIRENYTKKTWHELARPQIHGFDMSCLAIVSKYSFASGAEEKVIRTFQAPSNFVTNFHNICKTNDADSPADVLEGICEGASVPSLGLSNKAVFASDQPPTSTEDRHVKDVYPDNYFVPIELEVPPTEETLMQNTLWPEMHKLYGHGYEVFALAASSDGKLLASACKATTPQHAAIIIWDTTTWVQTQSLPSHQLTITQLSFSPDNRSLLSVSRDRRWSVFEKNAENVFTLVGTTDKKNGFHSRIIWCCSWTHDSLFFFTGSREGLIVMWGKSDNLSKSSTGPYSSVCPPLSLQNESVTALAVAPNVLLETYIMAAGFESGRISLFRIQKTQPGREWHLIFTMDNGTAHHLTVKRLAFRPNMNQMKQAGSDMMQLASCSCDHSVKIFNIKLSYCIAHSEILQHKTDVPKLNI